MFVNAVNDFNRCSHSLLIIDDSLLPSTLSTLLSICIRRCCCFNINCRHDLIFVHSIVDDMNLIHQSMNVDYFLNYLIQEFFDSINQAL
ncbi:hypothetical protein DERP_007318 [Dermatophagoides pteronyssinus]|uniref:Uncharacterized protein n=1 Tax=Dermatophagoides pteronyssinus TaxID=6956 RepID=A0ABQ8J445_DERPT|nr:hypothetical protein DERP_007318 [Dermatophagoides pteronyssinus]